jgi:hypothetical protein
MVNAMLKKCSKEFPPEVCGAFIAWTASLMQDQVSSLTIALEIWTHE